MSRVDLIVMSDRLLRAINAAAWAHDGQLRKGTEIPYISHVFAVMHLVSQQPGVDEDTQIAALFHDVLEDVSERYSAVTMEEEFGEDVVEIVQWVTKDKELLSWRERAEAYLEKLDDAPREALVIAACDKVHNLTSILGDYEEIGEQLWSRFNSGKESQRWWYWAVYETLQRRLRWLGSADLPILDDYRALLVDFDAIGDA
ncbi:MAG TPA: bifunctional (p)ppGpp synthetase/guanosine-3',5'-bis(diphosphate) 3'-pyrophosphohydrolase [Corynebacterium stationis]|nr:bifunctional (p)ppGpp synthetase/guanosine-3',5'-bis(diphosphate) 3'-pyrophosphohydrolase [Corynebacterium stationis]